MKCPACTNENGISTERRPYGESFCPVCSYKGKAIEFQESKPALSSKWSNALNKPWYSMDNGLIVDIENNVPGAENLVDALNDATEKAVSSANKIQAALKILSGPQGWTDLKIMEAMAILRGQFTPQVKI